MRETVLVTGSSRGIGKATILEFAKKGYDVVINYNNSEIEALSLKKEVEEKYNVKALAVKCDVSKEDEVDEMVNSIISKFGHIDVLVNNAAIENTNDFFDKTKESFREVIDINLIGTFLVSKIVGKHMLENKKGRIINISSNNGIDKYDSSTV